MTVVEMESLPLGFRFRPTDEELVNHYLKSKITGNGSPDVHVIPEVDLSKCEPWDLPGKSLIKSDDQEWFFFGARDRKYPNGHRSNRATGAGYWKATGKDRIIHSRSREKNRPTIIGIKKTLVFHRGRAPRGIRTGWIMHEYRTTEPEYESGNQGGYVLYRLFNKEEERTPVKDENETDEIISSPVSERQNEVQPVPNLQEGPPTLSEFTSSTLQPSHPDECLADLANNSVTSSTVTPSAVDQGSKDTREDAIMQLQNIPLDEVDGFPSMTSPLRPYTDHPFPNNLNQEDYMKLLNFDSCSNPELVDNLLDSELPNPPNYSTTNQQDSAVNEDMYWPYEQLGSEDVDYTNDEINDITKSRALTEDTGITILGRGVKRPTDENLQFLPQTLQGTAKRRLYLLINEWWGGSCTITDGKKDKVLQPTGGDASLANEHEDLPISGPDGAPTDKTKAEVMSRDKLYQKGDPQPKGGVWTGTIWYSTRFALCIILVSVCFGIWSKSAGSINW
ncbi:uncharacterized protein LOC144572591 isoform X1 [Carex rostrata]